MASLASLSSISSTMASAIPAALAPKFHRPPHSNAPTMAGSSAIPAGTFVPGTKVQVGNHRVVIEKYLSEGGFAHVYLVRLPKPINGDDAAVLKRVAVPDKESLTSMRTEVETMKKLRGHPYIVTYIDSHASQLKGGGFEVFLLMEYCSGSGLIDFMNTRLQNRLTEPEILKIFSDVAQGVAGMHYLPSPLLHRDLKVENILISMAGVSRRFKLCDFGSTASPSSAATSATEGRLIEEDIQKNTTLQYRSPEMIDVYRKQPIDEKSDIWALGVLLYKLCYYTTPFEEQGQMAILNASFKYPGSPVFSDSLKALIASMLREKPSMRPNIYQVMRDVCLIRGSEVPIQDIYSGRMATEARRNQSLPLAPSHVPAPIIGAYKAPVVEEKAVIPDIVPMRRGRPANAGSLQSTTKPSPSPLRGSASDPFAALDSKVPSVPSVVDDDAAARFPPLDQFSLLHEAGSKFAFEQKTPEGVTPSSSKSRDISQRVTEALADDAFAVPAKDVPKFSKSTPIPSQTSRTSSTQTIVATALEHKPTMVSTGTMTALESSQSRPQLTPNYAPAIQRFPRHDGRASSQSRIVENSKMPPPSGYDRPLLSPPTNDTRKVPPMSSSQPQSSISSRPSLESQRPSYQGFENGLLRSHSTASRMRPASIDLDSSPPLDADGSAVGGKVVRGSRVRNQSADLPEFATTESTSTTNGETTRIASNVDFLRAMEEEDPARKKEKRPSSGGKGEKRRSMPSISLSSTKSILAGRFGDAFRRFETNNGDASHRDSPSLDRESILTPITGSEATDGRSDDGQVLEEVEDTPEVRRELERRRLSMEERRVADAAAAYKKHVSENGGDRTRGREGTRAAMIQNKVQSLLDESNKTSPTKSAQGYGRFTKPSMSTDDQRNGLASPPNSSTLPSRYAPAASITSAQGDINTNRRLEPAAGSRTAALERHPARPSAPPKPLALRTGRGDAGLPDDKTRDLAYRPRESDARVGARAVTDEDWEATFSKRYPNLSLEMVETEIDKGGSMPLSTRDV